MTPPTTRPLGPMATDVSWPAVPVQGYAATQQVCWEPSHMYGGAGLVVAQGNANCGSPGAVLPCRAESGEVFLQAQAGTLTGLLGRPREDLPAAAQDSSHTKSECYACILLCCTVPAVASNTPKALSTTCVCDCPLPQQERGPGSQASKPVNCDLN
jgi:hypothetical protein